MRARFLVWLLFFPVLPRADEAPDMSARAAVKKLGVEVSCQLSPCLLRGDFDGDGKLDVAVLVVNKDKKRGIAIVPANGKPSLLGAGRAIGNGGDDFAWMDHWEVHQRDSVAGGTSPAHMRGDALFVERVESASAVIFWDGKRYRWYQQGD